MGLFSKAIKSLEEVGDAVLAVVDTFGPCECGNHQCFCDPDIDDAREENS